MLCPYCAEEFPLTWARYWAAPFGKHTCPNCRRASKFRMTAPYLIVTIVAWLFWYGFSAAVGAAVALVVALRFSPDPATVERFAPFLFMGWLGATMLLGMVVITPFDRYYDEHYRTLEKLPTEVDEPEELQEFEEA